MKFIVNMKLNDRVDVSAEFDAENLQESIQQATALLDFKGSCGLCSGPNVSLSTMTSKDGEYTYTKYVCADCGATQTWGVRKGNKGYFLKDWEEKFQGGGNQ